jgi:threonine synthase
MSIVESAGQVLREGAFGHATGLACRECGHEIELGPHYACPECFGPLEIAYDFPAITREEIEAGPANIWRYKALLPVPTTSSSPNMEPGFTRLLKAHNLGRELGIDNLWVKDDSTNPTNSFKDRVVACALSAARELGFAKVFACPSTGNLANAVAAAGARAGIKTVVFIPPTSSSRARSTPRSTPTPGRRDGNYDDVNRLASEIAGEEEGWAFVNVNVRPYYAEGSKTLGYEIAEQLGWRLPDQIVIPVASGSQLTKVDKAFQELIKLGLVEDKPYKVFGAQATGCSPVAAAFKAGVDASARSSRTPSPSRWPSATRPTASTCSTSAAAPAAPSRTSPTTRSARASVLLARTEGIFAETAGGTTVGVLKKLVETGQLDPDARDRRDQHRHGLKTLDAVADRSARATIDPSYAAFLRRLVSSGLI